MANISPRCRHAWAYWVLSNLAVFSYLEWRGHATSCHPTLSRELHKWTGCKRYRWTPVVFVALGAWLAAHVIFLKELERVSCD